ncbi:MAG: hypothetical protein WC578_01160 [Candidatus Omnitrophota bacterium]|jgi:hypothetical protein
MSELGIYFGSDLIDVAEVKGKKLLNNLQIPLLGVAGNELEEKIPTEIKLVASFNDAFRRHRIEAKEACLCLSGRDLIIRTFEIPVLPKKELQSAIIFEAKKYIPFKVEELISSYQVELDKLSRINTVLFIGIKKDAYDKYFSILNQLHIKVSSIEYSGFSISRILRLSGVKDGGITGILCFDSNAQNEINFTVLDNGFPLFSRDINLSSVVPNDLDFSTVSAPLSLDKLKAEVRVSLDYYHSKFPAKPLKNMFVISGFDWWKDLEAFINDLGLSGKFIDISKILSKPMVFSSGFVKSYGAAISRALPTKIRLNLIESWKKDARLKTDASLDLVSLIKDVRFDFRVITVAVLICLGAFSYGIFRSHSLNQALNSVIGKRVAVARVNPESNYEELTGIVLKHKETLDSFDYLVRKQLYVTEVLGVIPRIIPKGIWLTKFAMEKKDKLVELVLEGMSYLGDSNDEYQAVNDFYNGLKESREFAKYFKDINIVFIDHTQFDRAMVTTFLISCKANKEAK